MHQTFYVIYHNQSGCSSMRILNVVPVYWNQIYKVLGKRMNKNNGGNFERRYACDAILWTVNYFKLNQTKFLCTLG